MSKLTRIFTAILVAVMVVYAGVAALAVPKTSLYRFADVSSILYNAPGRKPTLPPNRFGNATVYDILCPEGLGLAGRVDAVARVLIGDWLGETPAYCTLYDAAVLECYSGDLPERIVVKLEGSSRNPIIGSPLYTYGNELLLLLNRSNAENLDYDPVYVSSQLGFTAFYIGYDDRGNAYAVPCEHNRLHHGEELINRADSVGGEVLSSLMENDSEVWNDRSVDTAFLLDDLVDRINETLAEKGASK